jgi:Bacterial archaeo-eukaryotic release factor family 3
VSAGSSSAPATRAPATGTGAVVNVAPTPLTAASVLGLQGYRAQPSVSLLLSTLPGPTLSAEDRDALHALARQARQRLTAGAGGPAGASPALPDTLDRLVAGVRGPISQALALYASVSHTARFDLPIQVVDRCVIDPTFATRDLVRALHRTPRHVVLLLGVDRARLLDAPDGRLKHVTHGFPRSDRGHRDGTPARERFLREVDQSLGAYLRVHPAPLIIVGDRSTLAAFRRISRNTARLAGTLPEDHLDAGRDELGVLIRPILEDYLLSRQAEALALLATRTEQDRAVRGLERAWLASRWERPEMLAVEQGYFQPARLSADGDTLTPTREVGAPDVLDDAVDELIETVLSRGGWVALLPDHTLPADARVALTLRS